MRKSIIIFTALAAAVISATSCSDDKDENILTRYAQWRADNEEWLTQQQSRLDSAGQPYFKTLVPTWDKKAWVLIHYFNDRAETEGNLVPLANSTIDVRYKAWLCDGAPLDSSTTMSAWGPGIYRTTPLSVIDGWTIALEDMRVGDTAEIVIPFMQAYGITGSSGVKPFSNLRFNMRLVDIVDYEKK